MKSPLLNFVIAQPGSGGEFGAVRKFDIHTGIDLYTQEHAEVFAIEEGTVVKVSKFTGPDAGSPWWNPTFAILVEGPSGVILYGEVLPLVKEGERVEAGDLLGRVSRVLRVDKGRPRDMLHLELYDREYSGEGEIWNHGDSMPELLRDPMILLTAV